MGKWNRYLPKFWFLAFYKTGDTLLLTAKGKGTYKYKRQSATPSALQFNYFLLASWLWTQT